MTQGNGADDLYEDKFARVWSEIRRIDQLSINDSAAEARLNEEQIKRLDQRMDAQDKAVTAALAAAEKAVNAALVASEKAVDKAELAQAKVNETQNEFRGTLRDQAEKFIPRQETENVFRELRGLIQQQTTLITELRSRVDVGPPSLSTLQSRSDATEGRRSGALDARTFFMGLVATVIALAGLYLATR